MNSPAQRHVTQGLDRCAADDGQFGDLAHLQPVQGSRAALSSLRPVYTESRPGIPIDRDHPFRPIATGLWTGVRAPSHDPGSAANATSEITYAQNGRHASTVCCWLAPIGVGANHALRYARASSNEISALAHAADAERVIDIRNETLIKIEHEQCQEMSRPRRPLARMLSDSDLIFKSLEVPG